ESEPRPRIERFYLGDLISHIGSIDPGYPNERCDIARGEQRQIVQQGLHGRIEPVPVTQLQGQAFRQVAGESARRIELLQSPQHAPHSLEIAAEQVRHPVQPAAQVTRLVEEVEKMERNNPVTRIAEIGSDLLQQMLA